MSFFYTLGKNPVRLFIIAQTLLLISFATREFPVGIFIAFAPLFALTDHPSALKDSYLPFVVAMATVFALYFAMQQSMQLSGVLSWLIYFSALAATFAIYILLQKWTGNRLNKFGLIIFILGIEYIMLKLMTAGNPVFLADFLRFKTTWTRWNIFTGYTGGTLWILLSNLLCYQAVFKERQINWILCGLTVLMIVVPIIASLNLSYHPVTKADVVAYYLGDGNYNRSYGDRGEFISRTGAWVSLLIIIFTVIKGLTKKTSR
jgi:apolipoprotein N-acyltransferase